MKVSANEATLYINTSRGDVRRRPPGFIMHTARGGTDSAARASKASAGCRAHSLRRKMLFPLELCFLSHGLWLEAPLNLATPRIPAL